jgi:type II secretory pathway component PulM
MLLIALAARYTGEAARERGVLLGLSIQQVSQTLAALRYSNW